MSEPEYIIDDANEVVEYQNRMKGPSKGKGGVSLPSEPIRAIRNLAEWVLKTVRKDDDEPISEDWLTSCGWKFHASDDYLDEYWIIRDESKHFGLWEFNGTGEWLLKEADTIGIYTRGQLRALCTVFGIKQPEAPL